MLQGTNKHYLVKQNHQSIKYTVPYKSSMTAQQKKDTNVELYSYSPIPTCQNSLVIAHQKDLGYMPQESSTVYRF